MEEQKNLCQRILAIMAELDYVQKGQNRVNNQYNFVSHDQVTAKIHPLLVKHGVMLIPTVEEMTQEGNRTRVKLIVNVVNVDIPSETFHVCYYGYGVDPSDKGPGKAISYAYKYAILKMFALETGDDPDKDQGSVYEPEKCLEFDMALPADLTEKERARMEKFLAYSAVCMNKHIEDVKREALGRMPDFVKAFRNWGTKKKGDKDEE